MNTEISPTVSERLSFALAYYAERNTDAIHPTRAETLRLAIEHGACAEVVMILCDAVRVSRKETIVLPRHRLENLSRGKGWARKGRGDSAEWGERVDGGYRVGPGRWTVGGSDGFSRKGQTEWDVEHVAVGSEVWTVAK